MDESEENRSTEDINNIDSPMSVKIKPKKRSLVERELETNLTARVTSPVTGEGSNTSRYGRARRLKTAPDSETENVTKPLKIDVSKQPQAYKMHASNSPIRKESPRRTTSVGSSIKDQIENIYNANISLSRFGSEENIKTESSAKKLSKIYTQKDLIQKPDTDTVVLIKNMFSPNKSSSHLDNILERSSEKYSLNGHGIKFNGFPDNASVVKTLDFDSKKKKSVSPVTQIKKEVKEKVVSPLAQSKKDVKEKLVSPLAQSRKDMQEKLESPIAQQITKEVKEKQVSKNELFKLEAACEYQVGDLAWARVGTYPFWPCIVTREPFSDMFVKKKLFGRVERSVIHVTFFGDNGRRGWIVDNMLRKYHGRAEFEACRGKFTPESKKKDPRFYAAHFVSEKKLALWNVSVEEAETLMKEPKRFRVDALYDMLEKARAAKSTPSKRDKGGKITRTDSDVSLSESLYDTLFSEDDGKSDDNRSKRARNQSLDVSEVVTACLDNMAARSGIIQIQRQSHMDRWLQKAKSKTPEKIQPKLHVNVEREKRKDKARKNKEGKKLQKMRKNESLGSDTNLLPYQNEHDYSSVNYENHDINDSFNKNTDSASGLDSTLDTSTTISDIGVTVKIENISSSMEDCSQDDIITSVVNDDIVVTESENISKDDDNSYKNETSRKDLSINKVENNNELMDTKQEGDNKIVEIKEELPLKSSNVTNTIEPRRSKRKRRTFEGLNNSITGNKAKEPKLDFKSTDTSMDTTTLNEIPKSNKKQETNSKAEKVSGNVATEGTERSGTNLKKVIFQNSEVDTTKLVSSGSLESIISETMVIDNIEPTITNLEKEGVQDNKLEHKAEHMLCNSKPSSVMDIEPVSTENTAAESNVPNVSHFEEEIFQNSIDESTTLMPFNCESTPVIDIEPLHSINIEAEISVSIANCEEESLKNRKRESMESIPFNSKLTPMVVVELLNTENTVKEMITPTVTSLEKETSKKVELEPTELTLFNQNSKPVVIIEPLDTEKTVKEMTTPTDTILEKENSKNAELESTKLTQLTQLNSNSKPVVVIELLDTEIKAKEIITPTVTILEKETSNNAEFESTELTQLNSNSKPMVVIEPLDTEITSKEIITPTVTNLEKKTSKNAELEPTELTLFNSKSKPAVVIEPLGTENTATEITPIVIILEKETSKNSELESMELTQLNGNSKPVVVIEPLDFEITAKEIITPTVTILEKETSKNAELESTELTLFNSKSKSAVVIEPLDTKNTVIETTPTVTNLEKKTSKNDELESTELTLFNSKSKPPVVIEPLDTENTATEITPIVTNLEKETSINADLESTELTLFNSKSKPVVVIEPLDTENTVTEITPTVKKIEKETSRYAKLESTELTLFNSKCKPVVVIEPLNYENTETESCITIVSNVGKETPANSKYEPIELISFYKSSKPVVVIEPLDMHGFETQFIIKGSKQLVLNKKNNIEDKKETPLLSSDVVQNDACNMLKDDNNMTEASSTGANIDTSRKKSLADSERMEVDDQEQANSTNIAPHTEVTESRLHLTANKTKANEEPTQPSVERNNEIFDKNINRKVAIGEETYIFERTLSQDYDEIDGDCYDEYSHLPPVVVNEKAEIVVGHRNNSNSHDITSLQDSCKDNNKTSYFESTVEIPSASDAGESTTVEDDLKLQRDCIFLNKESVQNDFLTVSVEDNKVPAVAGEVSSTVNEENNSNQVSQDNNDKCIFLDQSLKTADAQSVDNIEKKRKSSRFRLNRTRYRTLKLNKIDNIINTSKINIKGINTDSDKRALESASINCTDSEMLIKKAGQLQKRRDSEKSKNDPEFLKYMEIRQDSLLDEQPDLTQDEIVTYLYQNWVYEEGKKSETRKIDDNEQPNLVKGVQEQPKKTRKKSKVGKAAELKNVDIRDMLHKDNTKYFRDESERQGKPLTNDFEHDKASSEAFNQKPMSQLNKDLKTVECYKNADTELEIRGKETVLINVNNRGMSIRRSRRSKDKQDPMKRMHELKDKTEEKCVLETALISTKETEEFIIRPSRSSKKKITNQIVNKDEGKCDIELCQMSSNNSKMFTDSKKMSKDKQDNKTAMNEPEFIKYFEMHQDALLDEQPDLSQDEIVTYLYQNWFYEEGNKTKINRIEDNHKQYTLVKGQETAPRLYTLESSSTKENTDTEKRSVVEPISSNSKTSITEYSKIRGRAEEKLDTIQKMIQKCDLKMAPLNDSEMSASKCARQINENKNTTHSISTNQEKCVKDTYFMNSKDNETADSKSTARAKEKQDAKKAMSEPEFITYLEMHQDSLLDDQPDLNQDEIVTYLYQNWLYEECNKSEMKKIDDNEQSNLVKGFNQVSAPEPKKIKKSRIEKAPEFKNVDIRDMFHKTRCKSKPVSCDLKIVSGKSPEEPEEKNIPKHEKASSETYKYGTSDSEATQIDKQNYIVNLNPDGTERVNCQNVNNSSDLVTVPETKKDEDSPTNKTVSTIKPDNLREAENLQNHITGQQENEKPAQPVANMETFKRSDDIEDMEFGVDELAVNENDEGSRESTHLKIISGFIEFAENSSKAKTNEFDSETASIKSNDSSVSIIRKGRKEKDAKMSMDDPEFLKYLEARQDALIDEQPDLTQEEIVTYLYQTWFYEESTKSDVKKSDETEQSNLVKGLSQELMPLPKKIMKKPKVVKGPIEKVKITDSKAIKVDKPEKVLKNADIRDIIQKPKRKATQSKPYYNEEDSDLEEEDLETFKIFDRGEQNENGEVIDEVELYFEQLTKPKPNVFKGYVRERVCEICYRASNLVKCKSCHGTYHVECVKNEVEVTEIAGPTRGRKKKKGRRPKGYDPLLETGSQSDERSQDANNSEETNISIEDEAESHIVFDEDNFETLWENKIKELHTDNQEEYASDQEINWEVEPGHCEIVDLKHKEKPIDYSDYKCNKCLMYETPVCFVCKSNKSPKALTELRQKCQVAHCHRYYHLECLDHWPQTQFNSWEPSKTNKKQIEYIEALTCPRHVCHTCVSDDPRGCKTRFCGDKLARCVKCPATYHSYTKCLPAGTQIITGSQIICPRHYEHRPGKVPCHVNTGWCFICALGGTLICCEYCPTSFHAECLNIKPPEGSYMCEDCETGRLPLYGEMVWVKLGHYRWWPGIVLHPTEIPDNILAVKHSHGEFVVRFFGQYDHYWVNRGRVFPFQEGDSGRISSTKSKIDAAFTMAMEHAQRAFEILKKMEPNSEEDLDIASSLLPPHYVKLKVNKPAGNVVRKDMDHNSLTQCDCDPNQLDPCGPYTHCLNRMLLTECGPLCRAGERCNNRAFERRVYPRLQAYRTPHRGWGLRTLEDIKQGQFVIEYVGELIDMEEFRRRMCRKHEIRDENFYFLTLDKERMIDAGPKGNLARFMNHCCEPNCETQKWTVLGDVRVGLFAIYDIPANSEVTFNYNLECAGIEKKRCLCGAKRCSGYIGAKPKQLQEDKTPKSKHPTKRTYKKRKPVEEPITKPKPPRIRIKPIKPRELTEIEKDVLIITCATNGMSSDSEGSRLSVEDKNPKALKRKRVSFSTDESAGKKAKLAESEDA